MLPCLSYVYWAKIEQINNWTSKWLWANSHSHIYLKILFNLIIHKKKWLGQGEEEGCKIQTSLTTVKTKRSDAHVEAWSHGKHKYAKWNWL